MKTVLLASLLSLAAAVAPAQSNPFFVFDNGLRGESLPTIDAQLDLVQKIGFAGLSWRTDAPERVRQVLDGIKPRQLKLFVIYCTLELKDGRMVYDPRLKEIIPLCKGSGAMLWPNMVSKQFKNSAPDGDPIAVAGLRELADFCAAHDMRIAIYPHVNMWVHRTEDALRVVKQVDRQNVGLTFNLSHALLDGAEERVPALIEASAPYLFVVTVNGADSGASKKEMPRMIQRLDQGTYDVSIVLKKLAAVGYKGPIGLQCYGIKGDPRENLARSMEAWRQYAGQRCTVKQ